MPHVRRHVAPMCPSLVLAACAAAACSTARSGSTPSTAVVAEPSASVAARDGYVVAPSGGERLDYCARPVTVTIKVDSVTAPTTRLVAGVAELRGDEGLGTHRGSDEVIYVLRGSGRAALGSDTASLGPGVLAFVPQGVTHRLVSTGIEPLVYFFAHAPRTSARGFRDAARVGCPETASADPAPRGLGARNEPLAPAVSDAPPSRPRVVKHDEGERLVYCDLPLVLTVKVDSGSAPGTRLRASRGLLTGPELGGVHRDADEVLYVTRGQGRAVIAGDTLPLEPGSTMFVAQGTTHGLYATSDTVEYLVVHSPQASAAGFRRRAARPGPHCPSTGR
jgi:mannose-6-phosphate isomerase-like protein (cupin superfamily)